MADVPKDLLEQIKEFEEIFTVDAAKLKQIVNHFVKELEKGMAVPIQASQLLDNDIKHQESC